MEGNKQITNILDSINKKANECQQELIDSIITDFEDAVKEMNDPLKRAKLSLDKAREVLDTSRSSMEAFESRVSETLTKFEKNFTGVGTELVKNTNHVLGNLRDELNARAEVAADLVKQTKDLSAEVVIPKYKAILEKLDEASIMIEQNNQQFSMLSKETQEYKELLHELKEKYELSAIEENHFKNKVKTTLYVAVGIGIVNLGLIAAVLVSVLMKN
jgi:HD superfamily phosphohydrolase